MDCHLVYYFLLYVTVFKCKWKSKRTVVLIVICSILNSLRHGFYVGTNAKLYNGRLRFSLSEYPFQSLKVCSRIKIENYLLKNICKGPKPLWLTISKVTSLTFPQCNSLQINMWCVLWMYFVYSYTRYETQNLNVINHTSSLQLTK